jgi:putative peptidoglycan lipid II flippase
MDSNRTILQAAGRFLSGTLISRLSGLVRDMTMAWAFGTAAPLAAFFVAYRLTHVPRRLFGEGGVQTAFIPLYASLKKEDPKRAHAFFRDVHAGLVFTLGGLIALIMGSIWILMHTFPFSAGTLEIMQMTLLMLPGLLFICLYALNTALLQSEGSYFTPGVAPVAFNVIWILAALILAYFPLDQAMEGLSLALVVGAIGQWGMTIFKTRSLLSLSLCKNWSLVSSDLKLFIKPLFLANLGVVATQINAALDPLFARWAHPEGPAWLWYAIRMEQLPLALFGIALSGALLPSLSRAAKAGDMTTFHTFLRSALKRASFLMAAATLLIFVLGKFSVTLLFMRGDFGMESTEGTTLCLWGYGLGLLPQTWVLILAPAFYALGDYKTPARGALLAVLSNALLNLFFVFGLKGGPESVAVATSLSTVINVIYLSLVALPTPQKLPKAP